MGACNSNICKGVGTKPGLEILRIDSNKNVIKPTTVKINKYEELEDNKCYVVLHTKKQEEEKGKWQIHLWCGENTNENEYEAAKKLVVELWNKLDKNAIQYRERKSRESKLFLSYFNEKRKDAPEPETINLEKEEKRKTSSLGMLVKILLEPVILQLIFLGLYAVRKNIINDYVPKVPNSELAYLYLPILRQNVPFTRSLEVIAFSSLYIWAAITTLECFIKFCSPKRKCCWILGCVVGLFKKIINLGLVLVLVFLVKSEMLFNYRTDVFYSDIELERLTAATFSLWLITFGIRKI